MKFLRDRGAGSFHAGAILKFYGDDALEILKNQPYTIARDIPEAGFEFADVIAMNSGIKKDDPERIKAAVIYILVKQEKNGHVFVKKHDLVSRVVKLIGAEQSHIENAFLSLAVNDEIVIENSGSSDSYGMAEPTVDAGETEEIAETAKDKELCCNTAVYLARLYKAEMKIARRIKAMISVPVSDYGIDKEAITDEVLARLAVKLSSEQIEVVSQCLAHRVVVITGGPGTGKTTLIRAVCAVFGKLRQRVSLAAPTGRAARRLSEVTSKKAFTLHKLLLCDPETGFFGRNSVNPLDLDVLVVDEASMIDTMLMFHLVEALPVNSVLILVGDIFQLPSVGPGNVLSDIIRSGVVSTFELTKIFRVILNLTKVHPTRGDRWY
jgi:exodeoxyribonuclease V alpha subunit